MVAWSNTASANRNGQKKQCTNFAETQPSIRWRKTIRMVNQTQ
jgi:hypothetical protein